MKTEMIEMIELLSKVAAEEVLSSCADEGDTCAFCGGKVDYVKSVITHTKGCLWVRIVSLSERIKNEMPRV